LAAAALRSSGAVTDIELAVGEAFSNAIKYGKRNSKITVRVVGAPGCEVSVEMAYPGSRFDTTVKRPADIEKATGGFGRYIIKQVMDDTEYSFRNGFTTLRMRKRRR
jgi:anti-sigma regulatory factor (Ser/Thr protein kinase)